MTLENKELLLKDLCARFPYGVKGLHRGQVHNLFTIDCREANDACIQVDSYDNWFSVDTFKPYLRPMSSMTEEEENEYNLLNAYEGGAFPHTEEALTWLNKKMFDYRGLIPMGLALEAKEGMYKEE